MENIRDSIRKFINDGGLARFDVRGTEPGVLFLDESEFIPFSDLGLSRELGYYRISLFPSEQSVCTNEPPDTIHPYGSDDDWEAYVWIDDSYIAKLLGEKWQVADLYNSLGRFLLDGAMDSEEISDEHPVWGRPLTISQACEMATEYDSEKFPDDENLSYRIRQALQKGRIEGAHKTPTGRWQIPQHEFWRWLNDGSAHRPGPKGAS